MNNYDLIIIGAGPAGISAAITADQYGYKVLLLDESPEGGGQVYRHLNQSIIATKNSPEQKQGNKLRQALAQTQVTTKFEHRVWFVTQKEKQFHIASVGPTNNMTSANNNATSPNILPHIDETLFEAFAPQIIVATGAQERIFATPGWTTPGVTGLAAATILLKAHKILPGHNVVVAGVGPLLILVANEIIKAGGQVKALVDLSNSKQWLKQLPNMLAKPSLLLKGASWIINLKRHKVPIFSQHSLVDIKGDKQVTEVILAPVDDNWHPELKNKLSLTADSVCLGHGLLPSTELTQLLNIEHYFNESVGSWHPRLDGGQRSSVKGVYVCGDGGGIQGAEAAPLQGKIAALSALKDSKKINNNEYINFYYSLKKQLIKAQQFAIAMTELCTPRKGILEIISPQTIVCRCEGLTRQAIENAITQGNSTLNGVKSASRCGMGACGGRFCRETVTMIIAHHTGCRRQDVNMATSRPPIRPIPVKSLVGDFDYHDLPIPEPAPE